MWTPINRDWTVKPPLGTPLRTDGHWSVQGLVGCWLFNEGAGGSCVNAVTGKKSVVAPANVVWHNDGLDFSAGSAGIDGGTINTVSGMGISLFLDGCFYYRYSYAYAMAVQMNDRWLGFATNSDGTLYTGMPYGRIRACITSDPQAVVQKNYFDGQFRDSFASYAASITNAPVILGANSSRTTSFNGSISVALIYNRVLSPNEIASLSANPYQVCQP